MKEKEKNIIPDPWGDKKRQIKHRWATPFIWIEWLMEWAVYRLRSWAFIDLLELAGRFTILVAVILYLKDCDSRTKQKHYQAWQVLKLTQGEIGSGGRIQALEELNKDGVSLAGINVADAYLANINLAGADLTEANLSITNLHGADLTEANLHKANLCGANLQEANLQEVDLSRAYLVKTNLRYAKLYNANLREAKFQGGVDLSGAYLVGADLQGADLSGANLQGADLRRANLIKAKLEYANFGYSDLQRAINITIEQLSKVKTLYNAKLDPELEKQIKEKYPHLLEEPKEE